MDFDAIRQSILAFVEAHGEWAPVIAGALAFCESLAFLSLLVPATVILIGIGALIGASGIPFWPVVIAAAIGTPRLVSLSPDGGVVSPAWRPATLR